MTRLLSKTSPKLFSICLVLAVIAAIPSSSAFAQESDGVQYVVQPGDTLSSIALRFDVSVSEIIEASNISNPDALNVGDVLIIPGIDWIDGVLVFEEMPLGESFLSLKRRYLLSDENMARLNRLTSPDQLYYGLSILLATERGELAESARALVGTEGSLLEIAAASGDNPWALVAYNQLPGTWAAIPGDVLFTPATESAGPGALPAAISALRVDDPGFVQGKTLVITAATNAEIQLGGEFFGHTLNFFPEDGDLVALQGIPLEAESGTFDFSFSGIWPSGESFTFTQPVRVASGDYATASLFVDPEFLDGERSAGENAEIARIMAQVTPERLWQGLWGWPHDLVDDVTSEFGVYRVYNGGLTEGYHYGTDFGGGALLNIYAPAAGRVVFAGPLDIRGNATIIDHGQGVYTGYWHQEEIYVSEGDLVEAGQTIGIVGKSGRVSGPHLHWEVWVGGVPVEPLDWLARSYP
ncbi:MAG: peptidoglycan DD-metalloendopeptidase family protein [Anaerolineales bacterium]